MQQPHEEIVRVYTKLASLKHALTRSIQEEVEHRHDQIGHSFQKTYALKKKYEISDQDDLKDHLSHLEKFNKKYERVASNLPIWTNSTRILHFGKALEKFKVSIKLLRTLMKDCDESASQRQLHGIANTLKMSKIIKELTALCLKHDFTGLAAYDS